MELLILYIHQKYMECQRSKNMRFIKFIKRILGLELNYLLEDEQENKQCENEVIMEQFKMVKKAVSSAGISVSDLQERLGVRR